MMSRREFSIKLSLFSLVVFLAIPVGSAISGAPFKIGYSNSFSGFLAFMGSAGRDGFLLRVDEINAAGGINGHKLEVIVYDDESDVTKGALTFEKLIDSDNVHMVVGNNHSGIGIQNAALAEKNKIPYIMLGSSRWGVAKPGKWNMPADPEEIYDYVAKFWIDETAQIPIFYNYMKRLDVKTFGWMHAGYAIGRSAAKFMKLTYKAAGLELLGAEEFGMRDTDMVPQLTKILANKPDALIIYGGGQAGVLSYKQAREMGFKGPVLADLGQASRALLDNMGQHMAGLIVPIVLPEAPHLATGKYEAMAPIIERLDKGIRTKHGHRADWFNAQGYDAALWVEYAIKNSGTDPGNLKEARIKLRDVMVTVKGFVGALTMGDLNKFHEMPLSFIAGQVGKNNNLEVVSW